MRESLVNRQFLRVGLLAVMVLSSALAVAETDFDRIVFFGDSLSDSGNAFVLTGRVSVRPFEPIPSYPYARGGKHFSNGATWAEQFARSIHMNRSAKPAFRVPGVFTNYAVGGSRARVEGDIHLSTQVALFLQDFPEVPDDALYSIVIGGNDVRDAIEAFFIDPTLATSFEIIGEAVGAIAFNISQLAGRGATQFLVANSPDLGEVPAIRVQGPGAQFLANMLSVGFNDALAPTLDGLEIGLGVTIGRLDLFALVTDVVADPEAFGLTEAEEPCLTFGVRAGAFCRKPDDYFFWDGIHPTRAGHGLIVDQAAEAVN